MEGTTDNGKRHGRVSASHSPSRRARAQRHEHEEMTLRELGVAVLEGRWWIVAAVVVALSAAAAYFFLAPPVYRSTTVIQIDDPADSIARLENLSPLFEQKNGLGLKPPIEGEIALMRSRLILGEVVDKLGLEIVAEPRRVPLVGAAVARRHRGPAFAPPPFGLPQLARYAWGGERIAVSRLAVPRDLVDERLTLVAGEGGEYALRAPDGRLLLRGSVGAPASAAHDGDRVDLLVSQLRARPGTEFTLRRLRRDDVLTKLQEDLRADEQPRNSGAVQLELDGREAARGAGILAELSAAYLRENVVRRSAEVAKTLAYLEAQLPRAKASVESAEKVLQAYRSKETTLDLTLEAKAAIERAAELDKELADLRAELAQLTRRYGSDHPDLIALERRIVAVRSEREALTPQARAHPEKELGVARLVRDVNVATELYLTLLKQAQALRIVHSGMIGNARVLDAPAVAHRPVSPKPAPVFGFALIAGVAAGFALTWARRVFREGAADAHEIEAETGLPIYGVIPHSALEAQLRRRRRRGLLAAEAPDDPTIESLRALRTALGFSLKGRGNVIAMTSPSPEVGKSFVCANLAQLFASAGKRVVLVDADMRRGTVHASFSLDPRPGLSDLLWGDATLEQAVRRTEVERLDVLPCGRSADHPAELLAAPRLAEIVAALSDKYDVVLLDTPPALTVTDPVLIARCSTMTLLVVRAGHDGMREISLALERFERSEMRVLGAILNDASSAAAGYARGYEHRALPRVAAAGTLH
jgi:tyrosine-protein kinase Etk/Wzc